MIQEGFVFLNQMNGIHDAVSNAHHKFKVTKYIVHNGWSFFLFIERIYNRHGAGSGSILLQISLYTEL